MQRGVVSCTVPSTSTYSGYSSSTRESRIEAAQVLALRCTGRCTEYSKLRQKSPCEQGHRGNFGLGPVIFVQCAWQDCTQGDRPPDSLSRYVLMRLSSGRRCDFFPPPPRVTNLSLLALHTLANSLMAQSRVEVADGYLHVHRWRNTEKLWQSLC